MEVIRCDRQVWKQAALREIADKHVFRRRISLTELINKSHITALVERIHGVQVARLEGRDELPEHLCDQHCDAGTTIGGGICVCEGVLLLALVVYCVGC